VERVVGPQTLGRRNAEILADFPSQVFLDFIVARNRTPTIEAWVVPPRVPATLAKKGTAMLRKMPQ